MGNNRSNNKEPVESLRKLRPEHQELRIVSLGKTGAGKSHTGNTILCDPKAFQTKRSSNSVTQTCKSVTATVKGRTIKYIDTPGYFDTSRSEEQLRSEILRSIVRCDPFPHGFLILLKVDTYTGQEEEIVKKITETFGEVALTYAVVLFTHGDDLDDDQTIEEFVGENQELQKLVKKCDGRCHVIDNKYWNEQKEGYKSNTVQIESLLNTIEEMVRKNGERHYNELQQEVKTNIDNEIEVVRAESNVRRSEEQVREEAEERVHTELTVRLAGVATGVLLGALLGVLDCMKSVLTCISEKEGSLVHNAVKGALKGGLTGYNAVKGQQTVDGAIHKVIDKQLNSEKP